jgi:hypothetical protein
MTFKDYVRLYTLQIPLPAFGCLNPLRNPGEVGRVREGVLVPTPQARDLKAMQVSPSLGTQLTDERTGPSNLGPGPLPLPSAVQTYCTEWRGGCSEAQRLAGKGMMRLPAAI